MTAIDASQLADAVAGGGELAVRLLHPDARPPVRTRPHDAGYDLFAAEPASLAPGERVSVGTGLAVAIPEGHAGLVLPRSGLAARHGIALVNAPGLIDAGYRGEVKVIVINHDPVTPLRLTRGDRIAQLVLQRVERAVFTPVDELPPSERGAGGHGSTGGHALAVGGA